MIRRGRVLSGGYQLRFCGTCAFSRIFDGIGGIAESRKSVAPQRHATGRLHRAMRRGPVLSGAGQSPNNTLGFSYVKQRRF